MWNPRSARPTDAACSRGSWRISRRPHDRTAGLSPNKDLSMPLALILVVINAVLIIHAAKTGRFWPWGYVILFLPGFGALGYILVELLPEWLGSPRARDARRQIVHSLDPGRRYRKLVDELENLDTISNRSAVAQECIALGKFEEAKHH